MNTLDLKKDGNFFAGYLFSAKYVTSFSYQVCIIYLLFTTKGTFLLTRHQQEQRMEPAAVNMDTPSSRQVFLFLPTHPTPSSHFIFSGKYVHDQAMPDFSMGLNILRWLPVQLPTPDDYRRMFHWITLF